MSLAQPADLSRRSLLTAGALVVAFSLPPRAMAQEGGAAQMRLDPCTETCLERRSCFNMSDPSSYSVQLSGLSISPK